MSDEAIYVAASGALVQEMRLEVLSNNLANVETIGFKEDRTVFSNYLSNSQNGISNTESSVPDMQDKLFPHLSSNTQVQFGGTKTNFSQGPIRETGNNLDFALEGNGFFCVETPEGIVKFTRKGNFKLSEAGRLVTQDGFSVLGGNGTDIKIDDRQFHVDEEGNISVGGTVTDTIKLVDFEKPYPLIKAGDTLFTKSDPAVTEKDAPHVKIRQGFIEISNVDPIKVMTEIIEVNRAFESYQKIIQNMDEIVSKSINDVGRTT